MITNNRFAVAPLLQSPTTVDYDRPKPKPSNYPQQATHSFSIKAYQSLDEQLLSSYDGDRHKWKPCQHYKCYQELSRKDDRGYFPWYSLSFGGSQVYVGGANPLLLTEPTAFTSSFGKWGSHHLHVDLLPMRVAQPDGSFLPKPANLDALIDASLRSMLPSIKSDLSLINSVYELKDFKSLPQTLSRMRDTALKIPGVARSFRAILPALYRKVRRSFSRANGLTLREALRTTADGYLQAEFNILPLLSDISAIYSALSRTEKALNDLLVRQGKRHLRHFTFSWYESSGVLPKAGVVACSTGQFDGYTLIPGLMPVYKYHMHAFTVERTLLFEQPTTFHAEIEYNFNFTQFQVEHARILALLDVLGVNLNPAIIWNAIPWTFLVDWLVGVSRWLDNRKTLNMEPVTNITRYLWSWKRIRTIRFSAKSFGGLGGMPPINTYLPDTYEVSYRRDIGIPYTNSLIVSGLSAKELSLGVALAITRRRRQNTRAK